MHIINIRTTKREEFVEITREVEQKLSELDAQSEGICHLFVQHTTAGLTVNENADPDVVHDMLHALREIFPQHDPQFRHLEGNSDAHLKASFVGSSVSVPYAKGKLMLGRWQGIYLCEFDGARERQVVITLLR